MEISVLGSIAVRRPGEEARPVRGERLRTVLGLMVIDRMLPTPFSHQEFCRLAAGDVDDPERARKMMSMGGSRLRDLIGAETISRDASTPRLAAGHVLIDALQVHELVPEALTEALEGALMRGVELLYMVLDRVRGAVLFPGLDDAIFTAAREEFTANIRSAVVEISQLLMREGEREIAGEVLRRGGDALPEE